MFRFLQCSVGQYMTANVQTVIPDTSLRELQALFEKYDFNAFPVSEGGKVRGVVSKFDFLRNFAFTTHEVVPHYDELMGRAVSQVMTKIIIHVDPAMPLTRVLQMMVELKTRSFPVLDEKSNLVGMISREDVMRALRDTADPALSTA